MGAPRPSTAARGRSISGGAPAAHHFSSPLKVPVHPHQTNLQHTLPRGEVKLFSFAPAPVLSLAAAEGLRQLLEPYGELVRSWNLPYFVLHWFHPLNMAIVLFAMGGYGAYLGWQLRLAPDAPLETNLTAKELHPKLMGGMFFFFALGATGGLTALVTAQQPILESPHAITGLAGLALLSLQSILAFYLKENTELRSIHAYLGTAILALFLVHAAFGLKLGFSF